MPRSFRDRFKEILPVVWNNGFFLVATVVIVALGATFFVMDSQSKELLIEQMLHREQLSVRAGARSIESFFDLYSRTFSGLATNADIISFSPRASDRLDDFIERWKGTPIAGIVLTDSNGIVRFNGNRNKTPVIGGYLGDRHYFEWGKSAKVGEVLITPPVISRLGASQGEYILNVTTPILGQSGEFLGIMSASVIIHELVDQYIKPLKITENSYDYLINESGDVLASDQNGINETNFFEQLEKIPFLGSTVLSEGFRKIIDSREEGKVRVAYPINLSLMLPVKMLVAYAPVNIGENHLILATATPENDALVYLVPVYIRGIGIIAGAFVIVLLVGLRLAKIRGYKEAVKDEHEIHNIK